MWHLCRELVDGGPKFTETLRFAGQIEMVYGGGSGMFRTIDRRDNSMPPPHLSWIAAKEEWKEMVREAYVSGDS